MRTRPLLALAALLAALSCSSSSSPPSSTGSGGAAPDAGQGGAGGTPKLCSTPADAWCMSDADCPAAPSACVAWRCNPNHDVVVPGVRCGCYSTNVCDAGAPCDDGNDCTQDALVNGACEHFNYTNLTHCGANGAGHCNGNDTPATCCMGCLLAGMCVTACPAGMSCSGDGVCL